MAFLYWCAVQHVSLTHTLQGTVKGKRIGRQKRKDNIKEWTGMNFASSTWAAEDRNGWMTCNFMSFSTVFQSYQDDGWMIMEGCVQWSPVCD